MHIDVDHSGFSAQETSTQTDLEIEATTTEEQGRPKSLTEYKNSRRSDVTIATTSVKPRTVWIPKVKRQGSPPVTRAAKRLKTA